MKTSKFAELRVKIKSLAAEARIIRKEELRHTISVDDDYSRSVDDVRRSLYKHRTYDVRQESRAALLAYAFLRSKAYTSIETLSKTPSKRNPIDYNVLVRIVNRFGFEKVSSDAVTNWVEK